MKKYGIYLCFVCLFLGSFAPKVSADIGPKPSVVLNFEGFEDASYFVTLLAQESSTGPWSSEHTYQEWQGNQEIWQQFHTYDDPNGFHFLGYFEDCSDTSTFRWTYYPPQTFKILFYFPQENHFVISSDEYERYAFDSYFTVKISHPPENFASLTGADLQIHKSYDFLGELGSLWVRIIVTIALETALAYWLFHFQTRRQLKIIVLTNVVTQVVLNVGLYICHYMQGAWAFVFHMIWMEGVVFMLEGFIFSRFLGNSSSAQLHPWLYAFTANLASFVTGMLIARWIPGIF